MVRSFGQCLWLFFFIIIWLLPERIDNNVTVKQKSSQSYQKLNGLHKSIDLNQKVPALAIDTGQLKKSGWYAEALTSIEKSEYEIKPVGQRNTYSAPNRKQNLRAFYSSDKLKLQPRKDSSDKWDLELSTLGVFSNEQLLYTPDEHPQIKQKANSIQFIHQNNFITEYINNEQGIRQNFIIQNEPATNANTISVKLQVNKGWFVNKVHDKEIQFAKEEEGGLKKKLTYNQLKVWDARHNELPAVFHVQENKISIDVETKSAVYPITIDPVSSTVNTLLELNQANAQFGRFLSSAGDVNGDGYSDVVVGANLYDNGQTDEGAAFIYHGSATGLSSTPAIILESNQAGASFGSGVSSAGDVNGDGYSDIIVGAYLYDNGQTDEGAAFVYYGSATGIGSVPAAVLESNQANAQMGFWSDGAGDLNADGYSDIVVGAYQYDNGQTDEGVVFVYKGSAAGIVTVPIAMLESNQAATFFGREVKSAGDVNGDGFSDIIVGAYGYDNGQTDEGAAYIFHGNAAGINTTPAIILESNQAASYYGQSAAGAGDVNGDGYSDVIVGAAQYDNVFGDDGAAFIYYGSPSGVNATAALTLYGTQASSRFGYEVSCAGDINADGYSDIVIGSYFYDNGQTDEGAAYVYYGSSTGIISTPVNILESNQNNAVFGIQAKSAGDVNGDGYSDLIIGAFWYDNGQTDEGAAFVYHGAPDGLSVAPLVINNITQNQSGFGLGCSTAGDVNGDGYSDVIIAAYGYDDNGADEGRAFVYYGSPNGISTTASVVLNEANQAGALFGYAVGSAGDVNGDGYGDVIVGAFGYSGKGRVYIYYGSATGIPLSSNMVLDGTQAGESFGVSVATAGDVNHDGYSDVIIGAYTYDDGANTDEGRALVYHGSAGGLITTPATIINNANQAGAYLGFSSSTAGDVNGDGYSDIIIGSHGYDSSGVSNRGIAFIYYGSCTGIPAVSNLRITGTAMAGALFGYSVAGAGDINGDGYSDVVVGSLGYSAAKGRAYVFYGSGSGLSAVSFPLDNTAPGNNNNDQMGFSVSSAGDINGDGYSDIIVGIPEYNNPGSGPPQGRAYVYLGRAAGVTASPDIIITDNVNNQQFFGFPVACAGDVNGDGFSDIVVGGYKGSWGGFGIAWVFYGNNKGGLRNNLRLYDANLSSPMTQSNITDPNQFGAGLYARSFIGTQKGKLVWQTVKNGTVFSGSPITNSTQYTSQQAAYTNLGLNGVELKSLITKSTAPGNTYIRVRVKYNPVTAMTGQMYGPWRYTEGYTRGKLSMGDVAMNLATQKLGNDTAVCFAVPYVINATIAGATGYTWQNGATTPTFTATVPGLYWVDIVIGGCTLRDSIVLSAVTPTTGNLNPKICSGQTYTAPSGYIYSTPGIFKDTIKTYQGCDSIINTINLTIQTATTQTTNPKICSGQSYTLPWGTVVSATGTYRDTLRYTITNCDSVYRIVNVTVQTTATQTTNAKFCAGQTFTLPWGTVVSTAGTYRDTLRYTITNCDSVYRIVNLTAQTATTQTINPKICDGQTYTLPWGIVVALSGTYRDTLRYTITNCDSVYRIVNLTIQTVTTQTTNPKICAGQTYTLPWGTAVSITGTYRDTLRYTITNCDSVYRIVNLTVQTTTTQTTNPKICSGQSYTLPWGTAVSITGTYRDTLRYTITNCDSVYRIVNLTVQTTTSQTTNPKICPGQAYTLPWGAVVSTAGTYRDTLRYAITNCDSVYRIVNLTVQTATTQTTNPKICSGQTYTLPWGTIVSTAGTYRDTLRYTITNCDSVYRIVNLTVQTTTTQTTNPKICSGQTYMLPWGTIVSTAGTYRDTLRYTITNCDSVYRIVNLNVQTAITQITNPKICPGQSYTLPWGTIVSTAGTYRDTLRYTITNCDSVYRIVNLTVQTATTQTTNPKICAGQTYTLPWGTVVSIAGTYRDTLRYTITNCDSVYRIVNLTVQTSTTQTTNQTICAGQTYNLPWGTAVSTTGIYRDTLRYTITNCDSVYRIVNITVQTATTQTTNPKICAGQTYTLPWGTVVSATGTYRDTLRYTITNCDSVYRSVNLTVQTATTQTTNPKVCAGQTYTLPWGTVVSATGTYRDTLRYNVTNCDSVYRIVNLIIQTVQTQPTINAVICNGSSYTLPWGIVVNTSGLYKDTLKYTATGCDSVRRAVNVTVLSASTVTVNAGICQGQSYQMPSGSLVNVSGVYKDTLKYKNYNCDSLYTTVNLTVTPAQTRSTGIAICAGDTYVLPWGSVVTVSGIYKDTLRTAAGCDSLIRIINLSVLPKPIVRVTKSNDINCVIASSKLSASGGNRYLWSPAATLSNAISYNPVAFPSVTTVYSVKVTAANGCQATDSITVVVNTNQSPDAFPVPNAFSPNNDGLNDCFGVQHWGAVTNFRFQIFNRWGELVFNTTNINECWNGTYKGLQQDPGGFVYRIAAETICGKIQREGIVYIIR